MSATDLRARQKPLKTAYREDPATALVRTSVTATIDQPTLQARVPTWGGDVVAGLHPATGGDGSLACSADIMLQALVACAGVTLAAVATASGVELERATVSAEAAWDARGTLGVDREAPVGLTGVELVFDVEARGPDGTPADGAAVSRLLELTERYCVVARTLSEPVPVRVRLAS